jgi:hypothetical protein
LRALVGDRFRCTAELRFSPYLTFNFDGRLPRKLTGSRRLEAVSQFAEMPAPKQPAKLLMGCLIRANF